MRKDLAAALTIALDARDARPLPVQIADQLRGSIASGRLRPRDALPSTRDLAAQLHVSRGTVVAAYEQLAAEGFLTATQGSGTLVNPRLSQVQPRFSSDEAPPDATAAAPHRYTTRLPTHVRDARNGLPSDAIDLRPGIPTTAYLADPTWRAAWRNACVAGPTTLDEHPLGLPKLREEIADHLRLMRGLVVAPERVVVSSGARESLGLLLAAVSHSGGRDALTIGVESPGYPSLRQIPPLMGHRIHEVPTDQHGIHPDHLPTSPAPHGLLVTPSHQYPYGGSLSAARRSALVTWAQEHGTLLIEDDYDSELRYTSAPLPALAGIAPETTALLGTFSSLISPAVGCGYLVAPPRLLPTLRRYRSALGQPASIMTQTALAHYLASGALRRRTQRLRPLYRRRRDILTETLGDLPGCTLHPVHGGLHAVLVLPSQGSAQQVCRECARRGIALTALRDYWGGSAPQEGIVVGLGAQDHAAFRRGIAVVAGAVRAVMAGEHQGL